MKMYTLYDNKTFYISNLEINCTKKSNGLYTLSNSPIDSVKQLIEPIENFNRNLITGNFNANVPSTDNIEKNYANWNLHNSKEIQVSLFRFQ